MFSLLLIACLSLPTGVSSEARTQQNSSPATAPTKRYLYVGRAPKDRDGFRTLKSSIEVFDIDNGHKLVKVIPLPATVMNIRGIAANAPTQKLFISHYGTMKGGETGYVLCLDLVKETVLWHQKYESSVDRGAVSPDGKWLFMPSGEDTPTPYFYTIDATRRATNSLTGGWPLPREPTTPSVAWTIPQCLCRPSAKKWGTITYT